MKTLLLTLAVSLTLFSCKKTYTCKDSTGNAVGTVDASSQSKANALCPAGTTAS